MNVFLIAFCLLPPVLLGAKTGLKWRISSWWLLGAFVPVGWVLISLATRWHFDELARLGDPRATVDGATLVFAYFLGWVQAALYFGVWVAVYRAPACLSLMSRSRPIQIALLSGALFSLYVMGVHVRGLYGISLVVQNNGEDAVKEVVVKVAGQPYRLADIEPRDSGHIFVTPLSESSVTLQFRDSANHEHEETILGYVEEGYCGDATATILGTQVTSRSNYDIRCLKSWLGFF